jgi:hypothetical protein
MDLIFYKSRNQRVSFGAPSAALGNGWEYTNNAWVVDESGRAYPTPSLGAELFANGTFAVDANWTKGVGWAMSGGTANHSATSASTLSQAVGTINNWYKISFDIASISGGSGVAANFGAVTNQGQSRNITTTGTKNTARQQITSTTAGIRATLNTVASIDNASMKQITTSDMFATKNFGKTNATITVTPSMLDAMPCGIVGWMDSYTNPQNYIISYSYGTIIFVDKIVAGAPTNLIAVAITGLTNPLSLTGIRSGSDLLIAATYNGSAVGAQQAVSDADIVSNTRHGMFSTGAENTISGFFIK